MAEQFKSMSPEDVREKKMHDKMGVAAEKARENSLGTADKPKLPEPSLVNEKVKKSVPKKTTPAPTPTPIPDEIADKLQSQKNEKAYQNYEKNRSLGDVFKKGGCVKMAKGGSASSRGDGCAQRGKTRGKML